MFNPDFYPTPPEIIDYMLSGLEIQNKTILEPSAGKGNIVDALKTYGAKQILTFEKEPDLQTIVAGKSKLLGSDFLQSKKEDLSFIDAIIMNPPFSTGDKHILHAWEIAPEGCQIIALCNSETLNNTWTKERRKLQLILRDNGSHEHLGDCFAKAERKTGVEVAMVKLFKPITSEEFEFDGFFMEEEQEAEGSGIMKYNEVRSIVQRYIGAVKCFDEFKEIEAKMNALLSPVGLTSGFGCTVSYDKKCTTKEDFTKELQKESWKWIFKKMNVSKYVTTGVMSDINKFVEEQTKYPFTMRNIYRMFDIIVGTREQTMNRALEEVFDKLTKHHHENRYQVEGWKTNSHYLVNKKFILEYVTETTWGGSMGISYRGNEDKMNDFHKALCYITGEQPTDPSRVDKDGKPELITTLSAWASKAGLEFNTWYDWGFFEVKGFKKGTLHVKFKDENVWALFNRKIAEIKGFPLPEKL